MNRKVAIVGLGYVGLPVAVAFGLELAKRQHTNKTPELVEGATEAQTSVGIKLPELHCPELCRRVEVPAETQTSQIIAFDINTTRINALKSGVDETAEVSSADLVAANLNLTADIENLKTADFYIVAVPTPIDDANQPDLTALKKASETVGKALTVGDIVVYESTVYPGATEEDCVPVLEQVSGLKCGQDFFVGYSPERINPGDKEHTFTNITKIVAGQTPEVLEVVAAVYSSVVKAGVYKASSIKVAEAAKVIENTQRDLNIALVNELAVLFDKMNIDTLEVLEAAGSKWNFLPFKPGLVGGHCIGVDPYYLTHKATKCGMHPQVILAGRRINDDMGKVIGEKIIKLIIEHGGRVRNAKVGILGLTFKENCPDIRNSKVIDVINTLKEFHTDVLVHDPEADADEVKAEYGLDVSDWQSWEDLTALVVAVPHGEYKTVQVEQLIEKLNDTKLLVDIKGMLDQKACEKLNVNLWRL